MSNSSNSAVSKALNASLKLFARHGFNRTSMADIAEAAGISRATLYLHFKNKEEIFRALADNVVKESLQQMREAWQATAAFSQNLEAAILAKDGRLHRLKHTSPHGGELLASNSESVLACAQILEAGFIEFLCSRASEEAADGRHFEVFGGIAAFGVFVAQAAAGFKDAIASEELYRTAIHTFVALVESATSMSDRPNFVG
jgi:AcrR family transcriptional regulator